MGRFIICQRAKVVTDMKNSISLLLFVFAASFGAVAQTSETFDITTFEVPKNWSRQASQNSVQLSTEDKSQGTYCLITLFKSLPSRNNSKEDFATAWKGVVSGFVSVTAAPQMAAPATQDGWEIETGFAPFEKNGEKGVAMLVTASGFGKMANAVILTNTQAYQQDIAAFLASISLKKPAVETAQPAASRPVSSGYAFSTTNFDDGWTSTVQADWVEVTKAGIRVLIHHPNKSADAYNSVVLTGLKNAWDVLVAPRYSTARNLEFKPLTGWQSIEFAEADALEKDTNKWVHVVLFKMNYSNGSGRYLEFITANKAAFEQEFGPYHPTTYGWEKMEKMATYNKFGVAAADLNGHWTNDYSGSLSFINAYTGASAGTDTHASVENFIFAPGNSYKWDIGVASGYVGSIKFQSVKSAGRISVPNVWQVTFSDIQGKPRTYNASFSAVKGGRILWLDGRAFGKLE
jgi:hypothetical protein